MKIEQLTRTAVVLGLVGGSGIATIQPGFTADLIALESLQISSIEKPAEAVRPSAEVLDTETVDAETVDAETVDAETVDAETAETIDAVSLEHLSLEKESLGMAVASELATAEPVTVINPWLSEPSFPTPTLEFTISARAASTNEVPTEPLNQTVDRTVDQTVDRTMDQTVELAQNTPAGENIEPEDELVPLPGDEPVLPESEPEAAPPSPAPGNGEVQVNDIQVVGSSVFDEADFAPILVDYEGRSLSLRELRQMADNITQLYLESGYVTSRAVLSEQTVVDGVVQVRVVEGSLESIRVEGTDRLTNYVRDRINLANRQPLSQAELESQLQLLRADPLVDRIEASLRAGTGEGQSQLIVRVLEAPAFSGRAVFDTNSPPSVGVARMGIETNYNNILGIGDHLSASAFRTTTGGSNTYGLTYTLPLNAMNGTLQARYLPSSFELIDPALASLGVEGSSNTYELTYRQPLIRKPNEELALSLGLRHRTGETLISDVVIDSTRTSVIQFGQDYLKRDRSGAWGLRSQFNIGTGLFDATTRPDGQADGQFFSWLGQVQRAQVVSRDNLLLMQASLQLASESLLGADQFIVGGATSVRGYSQNARFGDNGFRASIEDRATVLRNEDGSPAIQIAPFIDTALIWNQNVNTSEQRFLMGTGVGLIANVVEAVQARLDVGVPLAKLDEAGDSPQDVFVYFSMDYRF